MNQARIEWLSQRSKIIGASDVAAILGESPYRTNLDVWADKTGRGNFDFDNDHLKFGRDVEGAIAGLYETRTKRPVRDLGATVVQMHPDIDWLGATLDRVTTVELLPQNHGKQSVSDSDTDIPSDMIEIPLELKHVGGMFVNQADWVDDPPSMYQIQVQIQCACYGSQYGSLAGMFPGYQLGFTELEYSQSFFNTIYPQLDEFWNYNVKKDIPPKLIQHERNLDAVKKVYPSENGKTVVLTKEALDIVIHLDAVKSDISDLEKEKNQAQAELRHMMGDATFGTLPDGTFLTLKTTKRKGFTVEPSSFRTLRRTKRLK